MARQTARSASAARRPARGARPRAEGSKGAPLPNRRSGQGAGSAYAEMLRRQAQAPRVVPNADRERDQRPQAPRRER